MTEVLAIRVPAKLNLGLQVVGRREDGFHELRTIFVAIDLCDELRVARRVDEAVVLRITATADGGMPVTGDADNLVVRAARAFLRHSGVGGGFEIELDKRIPAGGGLGGGSADAAAMLVLAQSLCGAPLSRGDLARLALGLGADVPFFLHGPFEQAVTCLAGGVGELLRAHDDDVPRHFALVLPPFGTPTAAVFRALANRLTASVSVVMVPATEAPTPSEFAVIEAGGNELEEPAMTCTPELRGLRDVLVAALLAPNEPAPNEPAPNEPAPNEPAANEPAANEPAANEPAKERFAARERDLRMSGSGSTLFVERRSAADADLVADLLRHALASRASPSFPGRVRVMRADRLRGPLRPEPSAFRQGDSGAQHHRS